MSIDASAVARVLGISVEYRDLRDSSILYLPQRIAVLAQGSSDAVFSTDKVQVTSAAQAGSIAGFGSPAHLICDQLLPANGDGVGTIPVTLYLLDDDASGVAATGSITPSGTQTATAAYRVVVNNILSEQFVIAKSATISDKLRAMGDAVAAVLKMPVKISYTYGTVTSSAHGGSGSNTGNGTVTSLSVTGAPKPGVYRLELITAVTNGGVFKLVDPSGTVLSNSITMTPGAGGTTVINQSGIQFTITDASTDFAVGDFFNITVPGTALTLTSKWKGASANGLKVSVVGADLGTTFTIVQPVGGLVNPSVAGALAQFGGVWESMVINAMEFADTATLDLIKDHGEGRWGQLVRKPYVCFTGCTATSVADATAVSSARATDRINAQLVSPGSEDLPFVVAARELARIAVVANNNPPTDYGSQRATGLTPGADGSQWDYPSRDQAVKAGSSTVEIKDGTVSISDVVTFWRPTGEEPPAYRYVCDIVKLQNILFNTDLLFAAPGWDGAPLIPDNQPTVNPLARKPKSAKAQVAAMIDSLALNAIISDPAFAKASITAVIDPSNPKRLNVTFTVKLAGNANIIDVTLAFGFFYGTQAAA